MPQPILTHDAAVEAFGDAGGPVSTTDSGISFNWDEKHIVQVDAPADLEGAFETDRFYKIPDVTVARPIKQRYLDSGEVKTYKKPAAALKRAAWSFDNVPYTLEHPSTGMVKDVNDIHGFWRNAHYDTDNDRLVEDLYIPVTDEEALGFIEQNGGVSVGFYNRTVDSFDGDTGSLTDDDVDGFQVDIYGNHIAGVEKGRCSIEHGCGLRNGLDSGEHGTVQNIDATSSPPKEGEFAMSMQNIDATTMFEMQENMTMEDEMFSEGDMVTWMADARVAHNPDDEDGIMIEILARDGESTEMVTTVDPSTLVMADTVAMRDSEHSYSEGDTVSWNDGKSMGKIIDMKSDGCFSDRIDGDVEVCAGDSTVYLIEEDDGKTVAHKAGTLSSVESNTDAPSGVYTEDGDWYGVAPTENADDEPKYELNNCNDVKDAWNLRGNGNYDIDQSTLESRIKRAADSHDCPTENKPWVNNTNDNMENEFNIPDLSADAIVEQNDAVAELKEERDEYESRVDELESTVDEINETVFDTVDELENVTITPEEDDEACDVLEALADAADEAAGKAAEVEDLRDELKEYRADEIDDALDTLSELGGERESWEDESLDAINEEIERREEVLDSVDNTTIKAGTDNASKEQTKTSGSRRFGRGYKA